MSLKSTVSYWDESGKGIVAILGEEKKRNADRSIRRTLSADMSSRSWLKENGMFSMVKKYGSDSSSESDEEWDTNHSVEDAEKIKKCDDFALIQPYVHPLMKRSENFSLQMCTEPLGSETGSDSCLSCYSCSRVFNGDLKKREFRGKQSSHFGYKKTELPPPLSSVSGRNGTTTCVQSRRENGRLVIEAVSEEPRNHFITERRDGRLVLSLTRAVPPQEVINSDDSEKKEETYVVSRNLNAFPSGIHKLFVKRLVTIGNTNPKKEETEKNLLITSPPRVAALLIPQSPSRAPAFNVYEYFWRRKGTEIGSPTQILSQNGYRNMKWNENQDLFVKKVNREEYFLKGCKETRKSIIFWEAECIPTS